MRTSNLLLAFIVVDNASCGGLDAGTKPGHSDLITATNAILENPVDRQDR